MPGPLRLPTYLFPFHLFYLFRFKFRDVHFLSPVPRRPIRFPFLPSFLSSPPFHLLQLSPSPISLSPWEHRSGVSIREAISPVYHPRALLRFSTRSPELSTLRALLRVIHGAPRLSPSSWNFCNRAPTAPKILPLLLVRPSPHRPQPTRCLGMDRTRFTSGVVSRSAERK